MTEKSGWNRVARWAGIGNNREMEQDMENETMVDELNEEVMGSEIQASRGVVECRAGGRRCAGLGERAGGGTGAGEG